MTTTAAPQGTDHATEHPTGHATGTSPASGATTITPGPASRQDGTHPRPQLLRAAWADLGGAWDFADDLHDEGVDARWWAAYGPAAFDRTIHVPYPPEAPASGIGATSATDFSPSGRP